MNPITQSPSRSSPSINRLTSSPARDASGVLKPITIVCSGKGHQIKPKAHFYLCKDLPDPSPVTGAMNLIAHHGLEHAYSKFCGKKTKEDLSSMLNLPGNINMAATDDNSSLRSVIDKPPITGKELLPLTTNQLAGFRLHPGQIPEQYRLFSTYKRKKKKTVETDKQPHASPQDEGEPTQPETTGSSSKKLKKKRKEEDRADKPKKPKKDKRKKKDKDKVASP